MATLNVPVQSNTQGVSLAATAQMAEQTNAKVETLAQSMEAILSMMKTMQAQPMASVAGMQASVSAEKIAKVAAAPMSATVWKAGQINKINHVATAKATTAKSSGKPCGSKSPNGLCQKCGHTDANGLWITGPFNPIQHFSLDAILRLDGKVDNLTHETWQDAKFLGISIGAGYEGNVVFVGFGKDTINLKPKNALALIEAFGSAKCQAATHVRAVLTHASNLQAFGGNLLA